MNKASLALAILSLGFLISGYFIIDNLTLLIVFYSVFGVIFVGSFTNFLGDLIQERYQNNRPSDPALEDII